MWKKIRIRLRVFDHRLGLYINRLLHPLYLFPLKLVTYTAYYLFRALGRFILEMLGIIRDMIIFPFSSFRNFLKSLCIVALILYILASLMVIDDYFRRTYGPYEKFFCSVGVKEDLKKKVVRIVGGNSEGSGFFIDAQSVITNFHVIDGEASPKIIFPDGTFVTPVYIKGNPEMDLAVLGTDGYYADMPLNVSGAPYPLADSEPLLSTGYPLGTDITGPATTVEGRFIAFRSSSKSPDKYLQTDINVVPGMSGGPLTDQCGKVVGINDLGLSGLSLFIDFAQAKAAVPDMSNEKVTKLAVDPSKSPEEGVKAFYSYIKARDMKKGFGLLSKEYLNYTTYEEWTARFQDVLDIQIYKTMAMPDDKNTVFVKFATKVWSGSEVFYHYYEGIWVTKLEEGKFKMRRSKILEVPEPGWDWYYNGPEF